MIDAGIKFIFFARTTCSIYDYYFLVYKGNINLTSQFAIILC